MIAVKEKQDAYFASFAQLERKLAGEQPEWLNQIRKVGIDRFAELGFPTSQIEDWKYTSVAPIASTVFQSARSDETSAAQVAAKLKLLPLAELGCSRLVFVNGKYSPELSTTDGLPPGVRLGNLASVLTEGTPALEEHLARHADYRNHAFVALNTALMEDGGFIQIPKGLVLEKPIYLLQVSTGGAQPTVSNPRNLIIAGRESQVAVIEGYVGLEDRAYLNNVVTEIVAGEGAVVDYCKFQQESDRAFHIATLQLELDRSSNVTTHSLALGGRLVREDVNAVMGGEGGDCHLNGLYVTTGEQHIDNHTTLDHAKPHCDSRELYKGILDGRSSAVFNGKIIVRKDAQKTDAKQSNKNLLLSEGTVINTKPQLEIYADDVKCTHGATIGQVDQDAVFYLRSRGIGHEDARSLLTYAFASEIIGRIKYAPMRDRLQDVLFTRLAGRAEVEGQPS